MTQEEITTKIQTAMKTAPHKNHIKSLYLFGSFLHGNAKNTSDVDLLYEIKKPLSYFKIFDIQNHLEKELGRKVDFAGRNCVDKYIRDEVLSEAKKIYG